MTITKDIAAKFAVAIVAVSMVLSAFAPVAKAQTTEDLQKMINDLLAQVAALQSQAGQGGSSTAAGVCPYTWTRDLAVGATGADVMKLQQFLNADADTRVAAEGAGSVGMETEYFGPATAAAVSKMQVKYRADILSPANLVNPTGYFGASSRAKANSLCVAAPVVTPGDEDATDEDEDEDADAGELSGEATLSDFTLDSASDDELEEGAEDAEIATLNVEFSDGDAEISRLDISVSSTSVDAWDVLDTVSLWVDGDKVAEMDASDEDEYQNEANGTLRFSGLDIVAMEDEEVEITIAATVQGSIDSDDLGAFTVSVDTIRYFDADGVATTEDEDWGNDIGDAVTFTIDEAGSEDELIAKTSSSDPDATTFQVEEDQKSDWYTVFVFDLDTDDSVNDIELNTLVVNVATTGATYSALVDDVEIVIDGVTIDDVEVDATGNEAVLTFDVDGDVVIEAGDRVAAELKLRFKALATEGATVQGSIDALTTTIVDAEGADDLGNSQLSGAATGEAHTLRTMGVVTEMTDDSAVVTTGDNAGDDYATFEIELDVTAFEQDVYISTNVATSVVYSIVDGAGTVVGGTSTPVLTSSADETNGYFIINEGETETVTVQVTFDATSTGSAARLLLTTLKFSEAEDATPDQTQTLNPASDYRTAVVTLVN